MTESFLGILQGITEFLPISSSGHLVVAQKLLGFESPGVYLELLLHLATLLAILVFFFKDILRLFQFKGPLREHWLFLIAIGTVPIAIVGFLFQERIELAFESATSTSIFLCVNGLILLSTFLRKGGRTRIEPWQAVLIGCAQALALLPGISRSGSTIACALLLGIEGRTAFKFSFLLSLPAILGAGLLKFSDAGGGEFAAGLVFPMILAFFFGLLALLLLRRVVLTRKFGCFGIYTLLLGAFLLMFLR
jgi:undecaprenyl-diphosphatase